MDRIVRALVVDDSAYIRKVLKQMLSRSPFIEVVGAARDGQEALELVQQLDPDVVLTDLVMPGMDGVAFVRAQMARRPVPIVVVSIVSERDEQVLAALEAGAIDVVQKPTALATEKVFAMSDELIATVKAAAQAPLARAPQPTVAIPPPRSAARSLPKGRVDVVALGISTGGPQALKRIIPHLPADFPVPLAIVLHLPVGYTELYAHSLAALASLTVAEAGDGEVLRPGIVLIAPAGRHLRFRRREDGSVAVQLDARPFDLPHRPSVDVLFQSAAEVFHDRVLGIVMTGMGADGRAGAAWIKARGGIVLTEAEETCIVYGMPRAVVEAGLSDRSVPLHQMAQAIQEIV